MSQFSVLIKEINRVIKVRTVRLFLNLTEEYNLGTGITSNSTG